MAKKKKSKFEKLIEPKDPIPNKKSTAKKSTAAVGGRIFDSEGLSRLARQPTPEEIAANDAAFEERKKNRSGLGVFREDEKGKLSGAEVDGKTFLGLSPEEARELIMQRQGQTETPAGAFEIQRRGQQAAIDPAIRGRFDPFAESVRAKQARAEVDIQPESFGETATTLAGGALSPFTHIIVGLDNFIRNKDANPAEVNRQIAETNVGKGLAGVVGVGGALGLVGAISIGARLFIGTKIAGTIGGLSGFTKTAFGLVGLGAGGSLLGAATSGKIDNAEKLLGDMETQATDLRTQVEAGDPAMIGFAFDRLQDMDAAVDDAEAAVQANAIYDIKFRLSDEYKVLKEKIRKARTKIATSSDEIRNLALRGQVKFDPERQIASVEQFGFST